MDKSQDEIIERAYVLGEKYEKECTGCAQTAIAGIFDAVGIDNNDVFKSASGLADGLGLSGNGTCGALVGGAMVIGYLFGRDRKDFKDMFKPMKSYLLAKKLHDAFLEKYGTCRCVDLQNSFFGRFYNLYDPDEMKAAIAAGMFETCSSVVGEVARMTTEIILEAREREK